MLIMLAAWAVGKASSTRRFLPFHFLFSFNSRILDEQLFRGGICSACDWCGAALRSRKEHLHGSEEKPLRQLTCPTWAQQNRSKARASNRRGTRSQMSVRDSCSSRIVGFRTL